MNFSVPILFESTAKRKNRATVFTARPLFFPGVEASHENLGRLTAELARSLGKLFDKLGKESRQDALARCSFNPRLSQQRLDVTIDLRRRAVKVRFLFILFRHLGRKIAFATGLPDIWFDLQRGEELKPRADAVFSQHFRQIERDAGDEEDVKPEAFGLAGTAWVQNLDLNVQPAAVHKVVEPSRFLFLGGDSGEKADGAHELDQVGRCLDWLYPDNLDTVLLRDAEADELQRLLDAGDNRPVLLVGPRLAGKTAMVHEYVRRTVAARDAQFKNRRNTWLIAPARLISGMSYVGQWENRLLAIVKEARKREHLLYFDDLIGLFRAGQSACSNLNVAQVLKPYLERRDVRVLAEITPEAHRVLRERDRGLADLFHIVPVNEMSAESTLKVLVGVQRHLEDRERCKFDLEVLPTVLDLERRYVRDTAFPGKAALFLRQLAVKHRKNEIRRADVLTEFHARSGLSVAFLDTNTKLERKQVLEDLGKTVVGQEPALQATADVVSVAKARLNDPERPLASFLFLGPTGVGKTQTAKAIAAYLFGDAERLVRFDMNEYIADGAAARLVGTFDQPEGLLTAAVRRQPFAVVLFDEIEKAHTEVFDVLLAVLGEGRLTDSLGRTVDFTNTILILTSNLGVCEAEGRMGIGGDDDAARDDVFVRAAERFFRPEFYNRLDRVIPFRRLSREQVRKIAELLIRDVFQREGLVQRKCVLQVDERALERVVDLGFDPELGARALKRSIERQLTQPAAARLAALRPDTFTIVRLFPAKDEIAVQVQGLEQVKPLAALRDGGRKAAGGFELLSKIQSALERIESELAPLRPTGPVTLGKVTSSEYRYYALRDRLNHVRDLVRNWEQRLVDDRRAVSPKPAYLHGERPRGGLYKVVRNYNFDTSAGLLREMAAALDIDEYLRDLVSTAVPADESDATELVQQVALLDTIARSVANPKADRVVVMVRGLDARDLDPWYWLRDVLEQTVDEDLGLESQRLAEEQVEFATKEKFFAVHGPHAMATLGNEVGTHLMCPTHANIIPLQVFLLPMAETELPRDVIQRWLNERAEWRDNMVAGATCVNTDPGPFGHVVRIYHFPEHGRFGGSLGPCKAIDLRTGLIIERLNLSMGFKEFALAGLPLPPELK